MANTNWHDLSGKLRLEDHDGEKLNVHEWFERPMNVLRQCPIDQDKARIAAKQLRASLQLLAGRREQLEALIARLKASGGKNEAIEQVQSTVNSTKEGEREIEEWVGNADKQIAETSAEQAVVDAQRRQKMADELTDAAMSAVAKGAYKGDPLHQMHLAAAISPIGASERPMRVQLKRAEIPDTPDTPLWMLIREASLDIGFDSYEQFMELVLGGKAPTEDTAVNAQVRSRVKDRMRLPFPDTDPYRFLKAATEVFMMLHSGVLMPSAGESGGTIRPEENPAKRYPRITFPFRDQLYALRRGIDIRSAGDPAKRLAELASPLPDRDVSEAVTPFPYLAIIRQKLSDVPLRPCPNEEGVARINGLLLEKLEHPCLIELIWSYWHEEGMLVQAMNAISRRFQNIRVNGCDPLWNFELDPLRPLGNFLWGYIQDEQHRLSVARRAYEYDHQYGLTLVGKAVPEVNGADSRGKFLEAFHNLLHLCNGFYKEDDDTTVIADGFPILNALRELNLILSEGAGNQYGDLPWTARQEMLMQQWLLARPEMREFLPTRVMVAYPEAWMDSVDAMKGLMGWGNTSVMHFRELGIYGERLLLGARYNDWTKIVEPERAANWARFWRPEAQGYLHAYRAVTGLDLSQQRDATMPSTLLRQRLASVRPGAR